MTDIEMAGPPAPVEWIGSGPPTTTGIEQSGPVTATLLGGDVVAYRHDQQTAQSVWLVEHDLSRYPAAVSVFAADFSEQYDEFFVQHLDTFRLRIAMDLPTAGIALLI
jgi:hypothetical protein